MPYSVGRGRFRIDGPSTTMRLGARIVVSLINELTRRGGGIGAAALCGGGGQGDALIVRV